MPSTDWYPQAKPLRRSWVLTNGEIVDYPDLEESPSGRRVRLPGTKKSQPATDADALAFTHVYREARERGHHILTEVLPPGIFGGKEEQPILHVLDNPSVDSWRASGTSTRYWWEFANPENGHIRMRVDVIVEDESYGGYYGSRQRGARRVVRTTVNSPYFLPAWVTGDAMESGHAKLVDPPHAHTTDVDFARLAQMQETVNRQGRVTHDWQETLSRWGAGGEFWWSEDEVISRRGFLDDDKGVMRETLRRVRQWHEAGELHIPNLATLAFDNFGLGNQKVTTLELVASNVTQETVEGLVTLIEGSDSIAKAVESYREMQRHLASTGLVLGDLRESDILRLLANHTETLSVGVPANLRSAERASWRPTDTADTDHVLTVDLMSGRFLLSCAQRALNSDEMLSQAAEEWVQAKAVASITGEEPELLAMARLVAQRNARQNVATQLAASR